MAYNKASEERRWIQWKNREEELLREYGMDEETILKLRQMDWETFNSERRYREHQVEVSGYIEESSIAFAEPEIKSISELIDSIENEQLLHILMTTDKATLRVILLKMMGYSVKEISNITNTCEKTIYTKMGRLKKKIKKIFNS